MLEADPLNTALHDGVALLHAEIGNVAGVAAHFAEARRLNPQSPASHYNHGMALLMLRRGDDAAAAFEAAIALDAAYARAHDGLGLVRQAQGRIDDALALFERAVTLDPANADARRHLQEMRRLR